MFNAVSLPSQSAFWFMNKLDATEQKTYGCRMEVDSKW